MRIVRSCGLLVVGLVTLAACGRGQPADGQPQGEMRPEDASRIRPLPPIGITVTPKVQSGKLVEMEVRWKASPLAKILAYDVFSKKEGEGSFRKLQRVKSPLFIDKLLLQESAEYAVSAVDIYGNSSRLSQPVKAEGNPTNQR